MCMEEFIASHIWPHLLLYLNNQSAWADGEEYADKLLPGMGFYWEADKMNCLPKVFPAPYHQ